MILIGSAAAAHWGLNRSEPKDVDVWGLECEKESMQGDSQVVPSEVYYAIPTKLGIATADALYTIKCSHFGWNVMWDKTKADILHMKSKGCKLLPDLFNILVAHWKVEHGNKEFLCLSKEKQEFFNDHVTYVHDHDYLHELVASPNEPAYNKCLKDDHDVLTDYNKFCNMSQEDKVRMFREEITVIACERWLINPYWTGKVSWYRSYQLSLHKTITSLTKNWACDFLVQNLEEFVKPDYSYFKNLLETLKLEEVMSNVDMKVFEGFKDTHFDSTTMSTMIYNMCEGDVWVDTGLEYPDKGDREYQDASYQSELSEYRKLNSAAQEKGLEEMGYKHLEQDGGGEGGSEYCYGVFELKGKIYKADYSYYSHQGHEYDYIVDTLQEVKPVEKTVTVYE